MKQTLSPKMIQWKQNQLIKKQDMGLLFKDANSRLRCETFL